MHRGKVNVVLRVKPLGDGQSSDRITVVDSEESGASIILKKSNKSEQLFQYRFYRALEDASQEKTYQVCGGEVIKSCLEGYNGTIIAYGQTGAGKTYTMFGPEGITIHDVGFHGIMPRAIEHVFTAVEQCLEWKVKMTYVEIYNETFRDLLSSSRTPISIQDNTTKSKGHTVLKGGQESRMVAAHAMNDRSSRSHAIVTLWLEITDENGRILKSKLNLVDLAGSERVRKTGASGTIAKEATFINKSLSCLSLVAKELRRKAVHVHYRDSKLTHYLKDSIGGNCRTFMVACIWGDVSNYNESLSTCRFADDIQNVEVTASKSSGVESVHGKLFKMNPAMAKYIEQMMEKRVAEEKAKMFRNLKKRGLVTTEFGDEDVEGALSNDVCDKALRDEEKSELEILRNKVKELEQLENSRKIPETVEKIETSPFLASTGVASMSCSELDTLRRKVEILEVEKKAVQDEMRKQMKDAEHSLLEELQELRGKVGDLQEIRALSQQECMELYVLRERMAEVSYRLSKSDQYDKQYHTWHPDQTHNGSCDVTFQGSLYQPQSQSKMGISVHVMNEHTTEAMTTSQCIEKEGYWESVEQQARVVGELEGLRDRLKQLYDVAMEKANQKEYEERSSLGIIDQCQSLDGRCGYHEDSQVLDELESMKSRLRVLHSIPAHQLKSENIQELAQIKNKISSLQNDEKVKTIRMAKHVDRVATTAPPVVAVKEFLPTYLEAENSESPPTSLKTKNLSISSDFTSTISVESSAKGSLSSGFEPMQKPNAPLRMHSGKASEIVKLPVSPIHPHRRISNIPPFPGSQPTSYVDSTNSSHSNQAPDLDYSRVSEFDSLRVAQSMMQTKFPTKSSLRKKMSSHFWKLVGFSKHDNPSSLAPNHATSKEREKSFDEIDNIVILNSLSHDQLLDLLRDRYASRQCLGTSAGSGQTAVPSSLDAKIFLS